MDTRHRFTEKVTIRNALRTSLTVPPAVLITIAMVGCASDASENTQVAPSSTSSAPASDPTATQTPAVAATSIVLEIDGEEIAGELDESATSVSLLAQLPLTLTFRDYGGHEKYAELPEALDLAGAPEGSAAAPLTIGYYVPQQRLILYYDPVGYFNGIVPMGTYESSDAIENRTGDFTVTISAR